MNVRTIAVRLVKFIFFKTPLYRHFLPVMKFDMSICQLSFIIQSLLKIKGAGNVLEIGVGGGSTSIIINQIIKTEKSLKEDINVQSKSKGRY